MRSAKRSSGRRTAEIPCDECHPHDIRFDIGHDGTRAQGAALPGVLALALYAISFALFLLTWLVMADYIVRSALFPSPVSVFRQAVALLRDGTLIENVGKVWVGSCLVFCLDR